MSSDSSQIESVVFDIGRVLVDFDYDTFAAFLREHGAVIDSREEFIEKTELLRYETGAISTGEFLDRVEGMLLRPPSRGLLAERWQRIFTPIEEMISLLPLLRGRVRLFLMSNTNELHWQYVSSEYGLRDMVDGAITSFEVNAMKPDRRIFHEAAARHSLYPSRTLLIDDVLEHIEAARELGWHGIHHTDPVSTRTALGTLLA